MCVSEKNYDYNEEELRVDVCICVHPPFGLSSFVFKVLFGLDGVAATSLIEFYDLVSVSVVPRMAVATITRASFSMEPTRRTQDKKV